MAGRSSCESVLHFILCVLCLLSSKSSFALGFLASRAKFPMLISVINFRSSGFRVIYIFALQDARFVWKTVPISTYKTIVLTCRFLSSEGIAECERVSKKDKPSLQEISRAALNVSTKITKRDLWYFYS